MNKQRQKIYSLFLLLNLLLFVPSLQAQAPTVTVTQVCPTQGIQRRAATFEPGGIVLTAFDKSGIWVYDIDRNSRYPLPETHPCGTNCRLSPDARWITYLDAETATFSKMRLNGTQRTPIVRNATDIEWWGDDTFLVWTTGHQAYVYSQTQDERTYLPIQAVVSVQPNGKLGIQLQQLEDDDFQYILRNLESGEMITQLGLDTPYLNAFSWSTNGEHIAYVQPIVNPATNLLGGEIFIISSADYSMRQMTNFTQQYGQVRINGHTMNALSWSPDGNKLAFWVVPILGTDMEQNLGEAVIHILDVPTGTIQSYCHFSTIEHTPNPPRLVWSPDSTHLMFGGNVPADDKGYLLLALDIATGQFTELSDGIYPALGTADVLTWGMPLN